MKTSRALNQLRIIGGRWRGRKLAFAPVPGLRPTPDRVRETLFNWLQPVISGASCLDLFAGSGALGIEAVSRGAAHCTLVEQDAQVVAVLRTQLERLGAGEIELVQARSIDWLRRPGRSTGCADRRGTTTSCSWIPRSGPVCCNLPSTCWQRATGWRRRPGFTWNRHLPRSRYCPRAGAGIATSVPGR